MTDRPITLLVTPTILVTLVLFGCTAAPSPAPDPSSDRQSVLAELGPYPLSADLTSAEILQLLQDGADANWARVTAEFPTAARPPVTTERIVESHEVDEVVTTCLQDSGIKLGVMTSGEYFPATEAEAVSWYACKVRFPTEPASPPSAKQLGYLYDYLVMFVAPCLKGRGFQITDPPTRSYFISNWPNQNWFPYPTGATPDTEEYESASARCPSSL